MKEVNRKPQSEMISDIQFQFNWWWLCIYLIFSIPPSLSLFCTHTHIIMYTFIVHSFFGTYQKLSGTKKLTSGRFNYKY